MQCPPHMLGTSPWWWLSLKGPKDIAEFCSSRRSRGPYSVSSLKPWPLLKDRIHGSPGSQCLHHKPWWRVWYQ